MLKHLTILCVLTAFGTTTVLAQDISEEKKACYDSAMTLVQSAMDKKLTEDQLDEVEEKITELEGLCDADEYEAAKNAAKEIENEIAGS